MLILARLFACIGFVLGVYAIACVLHHGLCALLDFLLARFHRPR